MKELYVCPHCHIEHSGIASAYEDGGGDYGDGLVRVFHCLECDNWFTHDEGFFGYEGQPDDNPDDDIPSPTPRHGVDWKLS